jgi:hypothetical protein
MAVLALQAKETQVNGWLGMAFDTIHRGTLEDLFCMAGFTCQRGVSAIQYEEISMIEVVHTIHPIVTIHTGRPIFLQVLAHEIRLAIIFRMAIHTSLHIKTLDAGEMATRTGHDLPIEIPGMARQAKKGCDRMIERFAIQGGWRSPRRGMTLRTILVENPAVRFRLSMALGTFTRRVLEHIRHQLGAARTRHCAPGGFGMTTGATHRGMLPFQRETGRGMIKIHHPVKSIMTGQAVVSKFLDVL